MKVNRIEQIAGECIVETVNDSPYWVFSPVEFNKFTEQLIRECTHLPVQFKNDDHSQGWVDYQAALKSYLTTEE